LKSVFQYFYKTEKHPVLPDHDYELLLRCLRREADAEYELFQRYAPKMFGLCLRYGGNETEAEDMLQEGFIRLFSSLVDFRFEGNLDGWVKRIFVNTALNYCRGKQKTVQEMELTEVLENEITGEDVLSSISARELLALIQLLPPGFRTIFNLYAIEEYNHREIAEMLGITEGTSKSQYHRARKAIRQMINEREK